MNLIAVILEKSDSGYSAYLPEIPGIAIIGETFTEVRQNAEEALKLYIETSQEFGDVLPPILQGEYRLSYKFDAPSFFEWMSKVMSQKGLSEIAGMNESLISQYATGIKSPGAKQLKRIETAIHRFAEDLHAISFRTSI